MYVKQHMHTRMHTHHTHNTHTHVRMHPPDHVFTVGMDVYLKPLVVIEPTPQHS